MRLSLGIIGVSGCLILVGCYTPQKERQVKQDIFNIQTRLIEVERAMEEKGRVSEDSLSKRIAGTNSQLDRITADMARVKGDIDALRVGVATGQMPGTEGEAEGSVATQIRNLVERIEGIEAAQAELAASIKRAGTAAPKTEAKPVAARGTTAKDIKTAFDKGRFKYVIDEGPAVMKTAKKGKDSEDLMYMYAESLFRTNKHREAALKFNEFIEMKPSDAKRVPHAKMRMGDCFRSLGDAATAKLYYQDVVDKHPNSPEAGRAKERLQAAVGKGAGSGRSHRKSAVATKAQRTGDKGSIRQ